MGKVPIPDDCKKANETIALFSGANGALSCLLETSHLPTPSRMVWSWMAKTQELQCTSRDALQACQKATAAASTSMSTTMSRGWQILFYLGARLSWEIPGQNYLSGGAMDDASLMDGGWMLGRLNLWRFQDSGPCCLLCWVWFFSWYHGCGDMKHRDSIQHPVT